MLFVFAVAQLNSFAQWLSGRAKKFKNKREKETAKFKTQHAAGW